MVNNKVIRCLLSKTAFWLLMTLSDVYSRVHYDNDISKPYFVKTNYG